MVFEKRCSTVAFQIWVIEVCHILGITGGRGSGISKSDCITGWLTMHGWSCLVNPLSPMFKHLNRIIAHYTCISGVRELLEVVEVANHSDMKICGSATTFTMTQ